MDEPHSTLEVCADSVVRRFPTAPAPGRDVAWELARDAVSAVGDVDFTLRSPHVPLLDELAALTDDTFQPGRPLNDAVGELVERIHGTFSYVPGATTVSTPLDEVLSTRRGVCQDFAHVAIGALRRLGLASRYVSGYLETYPPPGVPKLRGADASHAWVSVRDAHGSWFDVDPTNGSTELDTHITLAWGRDYSDVTPLRGVLTSAGSGTQMTVEVDVERCAS